MATPSSARRELHKLRRCRGLVDDLRRTISRLADGLIDVKDRILLLIGFFGTFQ